MNVKLLLHTIARLRLVQVLFQLWNRLHKAKFSPIPAPKSQVLELQPWIEKPKCVEGNSLTFLNIEDSFTSWNNLEHGSLWAYNLNYFDWLCQSGCPFATGAQWIDRFIADLPQNTLGLDPYPIALRGINWIKFIAKYRGEIEADKLKAWDDALYSQYRLLEKKLEYHLLGNHLLEDAYSLFIGSLYFTDAPLYKKASKLLKHELSEQVLPDGAHYEQSPMYHCILLDRLLDCCNVAFNNLRFKGQEEVNLFLKEKASQMLGHLESICYFSGNIPLLNDSANGIAPTAAELKNYASALGIKWEAKPLKECGYRKMTAKVYEAFVDVGNICASYQPGHTHADALSYELYLSGKPFIVDSGISTYNKTPRRNFERSTAAHNTVCLSGRNSSEVWGGFRVGKGAKVCILTDSPNKVEATHNGFGKKQLHRRSFALSGSGFEVTDSIFGEQALSLIHLDPEVKIISYNPQEITTNCGSISIVGATGVEVEPCQIAKEYNKLTSSTLIKISFKGKMSYRIISK